MAETTKIEWSDATWNPWYCCHKISPGCKNCYMFAWAKRAGFDPNVPVRSKTKFYDPLKWKEPRHIFTCSLSDFFIEEADPWRDEAFAIMALTPQHTYQVLTKRPDRMLEYFTKAIGRDGSIRTTARDSGFSIEREMKIREATAPLQHFVKDKTSVISFPLRNVWLGVSVEDQKTADERIPLLLQTPAALRWLSMEPLLGPVDLSNVTLGKTSPGGFRYADVLRGWHSDRENKCGAGHRSHRIDWVVAGGESGPDARPMHLDWPRSLRDQCTAAGVPFFFKQWGEWAWDEDMRASYRVGKNKAGRELDGREWNEMPEVSR